MLENIFIMNFVLKGFGWERKSCPRSGGGYRVGVGFEEKGGHAGLLSSC